MTRAKVFCSGVVGDASKTYTFYPVCGEDNKTWAAATPCGSIFLTIDNPAAQMFVVGEHYFVDFSLAAAKEADEK